MEQRLYRSSGSGIAADGFLAPGAYRNGLKWFIDRRSDEMLEQIRPIIDEVSPPVEPTNTAEP